MVPSLQKNRAQEFLLELTKEGNLPAVVREPFSKGLGNGIRSYMSSFLPVVFLSPQMQSYVRRIKAFSELQQKKPKKHRINWHAFLLFYTLLSHSEHSDVNCFDNKKQIIKKSLTEGEVTYLYDS